MEIKLRDASLRLEVLEHFASARLHMITLDHITDLQNETKKDVN